MPNRDYIYYDYTKSLCPECLHTIDAKIVFQDEKVWMLKHCRTHGDSKVMIADDVEYYRQIRNYNKQSEVPLKFNTKVHYGCPYDCGLCTDHEQHSCLSIVEVTDRCNLTCCRLYLYCGVQDLDHHLPLLPDHLIEPLGECPHLISGNNLCCHGKISARSPIEHRQ